MPRTSLSLTDHDPITLMRQATKGNERHLYNFTELLKRLYQYAIFKPMLDIMATHTRAGLLSFVITDKEDYHRELGACRTIEGSVFNQLLNTFRTTKIHQVLLRNVTGPTLLHELAHVLEQIYPGLLSAQLISSIKQDLAAAVVNSFGLNAAIKQLMVDELKGYPPDQHNSELVARYFELLAMAHEIAGKGAESGGYNLAQVQGFFMNAEIWLQQHLFRSSDLLDLHIAEYSKRYLRQAEDIKHQWAQRRVHSVHEGSKQPAWRKAVKSIKDS